MSGRTQAYDASAPRFQASCVGAIGAAGRWGGIPRPHDPSYNRDDDQKPGAPQRLAQEPKGAEGSARSSKSGEHRRQGPAPNQAKADQTDGARP